MVAPNGPTHVALATERPHLMFSDMDESNVGNYEDLMMVRVEVGPILRKPRRCTGVNDGFSQSLGKPRLGRGGSELR